MAKALFADPKKHIVIETLPDRDLAAHEVRVKTAYSYISAGTELTQLQMGPAVNVKMEVIHQQIGYSMAGAVLEVGSDVDHVKVGQEVCCVGQGAFHATQNIVAKNLVIAIPPNVSMREAAPAAMMCFAIEGLRKAHLEYGENVLVIGGGLMGQIVSQLARGSGAKVLLMDKNDKRLALASKDITTLIADENAWQSIRQATSSEGVEVAFFCFGGDATSFFEQVKTVMSQSPDGITHGRIVFCGGATVTVQFASSSGNLQLLSSAKAGPGYRDSDYESGSNYPAAYVKWTVTRNVRVALDAIATGRLDIESLINDEYPFDWALEAYEKLATPQTDALAVVLTY